MPICKLLKTGVYNENTNRCSAVESRGVVAMESDGREGSSLCKLSGSKHVEPTSGQQCWQTVISAQHFAGLHGGYCCHPALGTGIDSYSTARGAGWSGEMDDEQTSGCHVVYVFVV